MGWIETFVTDFEKTFIRDDRYKVFLTGFKNTLLITVVSLIVGLVAGILIAIMRYGFTQMKKRKPITLPQKLLYAVCWIVDKILGLYVAIMRGVPLVVQLLIMAFVIMAGFPNKIVVCCIAMGLNSAAYVSEVVRGGINSVDAGQMEAGRSVGLTYAATMRYIIIPQAFKNVLPALGNELITLVKETSVVTVIGLRDLTKGAMIIQSKTYQAMVPYLAIAAIYLVIVMFLTWVMGKLERRLRQSDLR